MRTPSLQQPTTAHVVRPGLYVASPADPWIRRMEDEAHFADQVLLATSCLRKDPGCIEAHLFLAAATDDLQVRVSRLRRAVETGNQLWIPVAAELGDEITWWGFSGTRPYMRAIQALGDALMETGAESEARACYERLLGMNPNDNQGIRYVLDGMKEAGLRM